MLDPIDVGTRADLRQRNLYDSHSTAKRSRKRQPLTTSAFGGIFVAERNSRNLASGAARCHSEISCCSAARGGGLEMGSRPLSCGRFGTGIFASSRANYAPRELVVTVPKAEFNMCDDHAYRIMMTAHRRGVCEGQCRDQSHSRNGSGPQQGLSAAGGVVASQIGTSTFMPITTGWAGNRRTAW
jgi:hypothetical protein